jgi:hypothetical protein
MKHGLKIAGIVFIFTNAINLSIIHDCYQKSYNKISKPNCLYIKYIKN